MAERAEQGTASVDVSVMDPLRPLVTIVGELDIASVQAVKEGIEPYLTGVPAQVVFDLGGLEFMDSSGIAMLVQISNQVGAVQIRDATPIVRRVIELTGLDGIFGLAN